MNIQNTRFEKTAVKPEQYPAGSLPEVAFVGRSNVGKSSAINTLFNRKNLARTGAIPGKTRGINFYNIDDKLFFVDLPGYGYANVSKAQKHSWGSIIETYLNSREQLKLIIMMVDIRHAPSDDDKAMYEWMINSGIPYIIAAAKADKIPRSKINEGIQLIRTALGIESEEMIIPFSSVSKQGRDEILRNIEKMAL